MTARWRVVWCPHPYCNRFGMGTFTDEEVAESLRRHEGDCDGRKHEQQVAAYEARTRLEGLWERVRRRWQAKGA